MAAISSLRFRPRSTPVAAPAGQKRLFLATDGQLKTIDSAGNVAELGGGGGGGYEGPLWTETVSGWSTDASLYLLNALTVDDRVTVGGGTALTGTTLSFNDYANFFDGGGLLPTWNSLPFLVEDNNAPAFFANNGLYGVPDPFFEVFYGGSHVSLGLAGLRLGSMELTTDGTLLYLAGNAVQASNLNSPEWQWDPLTGWNGVGGVNVSLAGSANFATAGYSLVHSSYHALTALTVYDVSLEGYGPAGVISAAGVGFWGVTPTATSQPAAPTTLSDVINILKAYGMCAAS